MTEVETSKLYSRWMAALSASPVLGADMYLKHREAYSTALSEEFVTIMAGSILDETQLSELKIRIGHRRDLKMAASAYLPLIYGDEEKTVEPSESECLSLHAVPTEAQISEANEGVEIYHVRELIKGTGLNMSVYGNNTGVQWVSLNGTANTLDTFTACMQGMRKAFEFPQYFDRAWQDNRPMPYFSHEGDFSLLLMRVPDLDEATGVSVATITNRLVIMYSIKKRMIITYHRCTHDPLDVMAKNWVEKHDMSHIFAVVDAAVRTATHTYRFAVRALQEKVDEYEDLEDMVVAVEKLTIIQKKAAVYRRCIISAQHVMDDLLANAAGLETYVPEIIDALSTVESQMEEIIENTGSTVDMQMALDGFRASTNTKIFTYISVVCQPIGLATGWFGMNFSNMPELTYENSYFVFIAIVLSLALLIMVWLVVRSVRSVN